jgi:hypothetical protein
VDVEEGEYEKEEEKEEDEANMSETTWNTTKTWMSSMHHHMISCHDIA